MFSKDYDLWDRRLGWVVFFIALITYALTVEPTGSFWDAGEYIATSAKLQIGHPPGAPLLQMIGAFFAMFALEPTEIARMVNYVSGVSSAFTILFMFWTTTNLLRKLVGKTTELSNSQAIAILGSGLVGSLAFAYSDSFWFNAVVRGDVNAIRLGNKVNVQDGAVIHCTYQKSPTQIGNNVSVGHKAILHGCTVEDSVLIGMGSIVMDDCVIGTGSIIAAGAVVTK